MTVQTGFIVLCVVALLYVYRAKIGMFLLGSAVRSAAPVVVQEGVKAVAAVEASALDAAKLLVEMSEAEARKARIASVAEQVHKLTLAVSDPIPSHSIAAAVPHPATAPPAPGPPAPK